MIDKSTVVPLLKETPTPVKPAPNGKLRIDLGCGQNKREGFTGVDLFAAPGVDIAHDLLTYPWPFESDSVDEAVCSHFFEHIPGLQRPRFIEEVWRVLKVGSSIDIITPFWSCERAIQDYTHAWPPIAAASYAYFQKAWREANRLTHGLYEMNCDFDVIFPGQMLDPVWAQRHPEALQFAAKHYTNVVHDITARLIKKAM